MKTTSMTCPKCGAPMKINRIKGLVECEYCGNRAYDQSFLNIDDRLEKIVTTAHNVNTNMQKTASEVRKTTENVTEIVVDFAKMICKIVLISGTIICFGILAAGLIFDAESLVKKASMPALFFGLFFLCYVIVESSKKSSKFDELMKTIRSTNPKTMDHIENMVFFAFYSIIAITFILILAVKV